MFSPVFVDEPCNGLNTIALDGDEIVHIWNGIRWPEWLKKRAKSLRGTGRRIRTEAVSNERGLEIKRLLDDGKTVTRKWRMGAPFWTDSHGKRRPSRLGWDASRHRMNGDNRMQFLDMENIIHHKGQRLLAQSGQILGRIEPMKGGGWAYFPGADAYTGHSDTAPSWSHAETATYSTQWRLIRALNARIRLEQLCTDRHS